MKFLDNYVIRVGGGVTVFRIRRFIQMMALIICVASVTLLLYQNAYGMRVIEVSSLLKLQQVWLPCLRFNRFYNFSFISFTRTQSYPLSMSEASAANAIIDDQQLPFDSNTEWFRGKNVKNPNYRHQVNEYQLKRRLYEYSVTATPKPTTTNLNDIFISVKTTKLYHDTRLDVIIKTWFQLAADQVSDISIYGICRVAPLLLRSRRIKKCIHPFPPIHFILPTAHEPPKDIFFFCFVQTRSALGSLQRRSRH